MPWTLREFAVGGVPTPMFDVTTRLKIFVVPVAFEFTTMTLVVVREFAA